MQPSLLFFSHFPKWRNSSALDDKIAVHRCMSSAHYVPSGPYSAVKTTGRGRWQREKMYRRRAKKKKTSARRRSASNVHAWDSFVASSYTCMMDYHYKFQGSFTAKPLHLYGCWWAAGRSLRCCLRCTPILEPSIMCQHHVLAPFLPPNYPPPHPHTVIKATAERLIEHLSPDLIHFGHFAE